MIRLTQDDESYVRVSANYSLGKIYIQKANEEKSKEDFKRGLENAISFFENASIEATFSDPAYFCLPFYRSFYMLTFKNEEAEAEVQRYLSEAKSGIIFYPLGESASSSGGNLLYSYRKNLGLPESSFPYDHFKKIDLSGKKAIVFFDDIIGSGNQAVRFAEEHLNDIKIDKYYIALMAFEKGLEKVRIMDVLKR